jgi:hypothetical protein
MDLRFGEGNNPIGGGDYDLYGQITETHREDREAFWKAARRIKAGLGFAQSIDDFLNQHRTDNHVNLYGKAAIVRSILEAEARSKFYFNPFARLDEFDVEKFADTWFVKFMYMFGRNVPSENVRFKGVSHLWSNIWYRCDREASRFRPIDSCSRYVLMAHGRREKLPQLPRRHEARKQNTAIPVV